MGEVEVLITHGRGQLAFLFGYIRDQIAAGPDLHASGGQNRAIVLAHARRFVAGSWRMVVSPPSAVVDSSARWHVF